MQLLKILESDITFEVKVKSEYYLHVYILSGSLLINVCPVSEVHYVR